MVVLKEKGGVVFGPPFVSYLTPCLPLRVSALTNVPLFLCVCLVFLSVLFVCLNKDFDPLGGWYVEWSALPQRGWGFKPSATTTSAGEEDGDEEDEQGARAGVTQVRSERLACVLALCVLVCVCALGGRRCEVAWCKGQCIIIVRVSAC
jgi:hypothetical protein